MRARWFTTGGLVALLVPAVLIGTGSASASTGMSWTVTETQNPGASVNELNGVAATSPHNAWAVGDYSDSTNGLTQTLIEHWDGSSWERVPSPNPGSAHNSLSAVAAASPTNAWAVGASDNGLGVCCISALIEHWDGSSWTIVPSPDPAPGEDFFDARLTGVAVVSSTDAWAVGSYLAASTHDDDATLIEHWDGTSWTLVPSPTVIARQSLLLGVAATSRSNAWAVGYTADSRQTLIEHWDGISWTVAPSPAFRFSYLNGVAAISAHNAWAVGVDIDGTLIEHWNGSTWSQVPSLNPGTDGNQLFGVAATSPNNAWAVGYYITSVPDREQKTLIEHWDGSTWSQVPSPSAGSLTGVAATSPNNAVAVGVNGSETLALNCDSQDPNQGGDSQGQNQGGSQGQNQGGFQGQSQGC